MGKRLASSGKIGDNQYLLIDQHAGILAFIITPKGRQYENTFTLFSTAEKWVQQKIETIQQQTW